MLHRLSAGLAAAVAFALPAAAAGLPNVGVNLSGAEYGDPVTARMNYDYTYPTPAEIDYYTKLGVTTFRVPVRWQRLQPVQNGPLAAAQIAPLEALLTEAAKDHASIIIDDHDYGQAFGGDIGTTAAPTAAFANFWGLMAKTFMPYGNVTYGLMNEPHDQTAAAWAAIDQAAITAIRATGSPRWIFASGTGWDSAAGWISSGDAAAALTVHDPLHDTFWEVHQYLDPNGSGTSCTIGTQGPADLAAVTAWARQNNKALWLGEIGVCSDPASLAALTSTLAYLNANSGPWEGVTYWAGGPWMGSYMFTAEPSSSGVESPQTAALIKAK